MAHENQSIPDGGLEVRQLSADMRIKSDDAALAAKTIGQKLRDARERRGKDLDDIWRATKIRRDYLAAIEEGRFEELPNRALMIGYLGRYARYLRVNVEKLVERLEAESEPHDSHRREVEPVSVRKFSLEGFLAGLLLAGLTIIAYGIGLYLVLYFVGAI